MYRLDALGKETKKKGVIIFYYVGCFLLCRGRYGKNKINRKTLIN